MRALVTGGAGFIGSSLVITLCEGRHDVLTLDKCTYAANPDALPKTSNHQFSKNDILDGPAVERVFREFKPDIVFHLAAESHVDRSIEGPQEFIATNVMGTSVLLEKAQSYYEALNSNDKAAFRFIHVSTDEVFGALGKTGKFSESSPYRPNSPYSASKASSDLLVRSWFKTYGLPVCITNCSNNYGPRQHDEKLIPTIIRSAMGGKPIPIYGSGMNVRDWLFVQDHVEALLAVAERGVSGEQYCIGGGFEEPNIEIANRICSILDKYAPSAEGGSYARQITFVTDRPGHDFRYAIDGSKMLNELGWKPRYKFADALEETIIWQVSNKNFENAT